VASDEEAGVRRLLEAVADRVDEGDVGNLPEASLGAVADAMAAMVPHRAGDPWSELLGPVYGWESVARILGVTTRPAVDHARQRHRVLGVLTRDRRWAYPAFQFQTIGGRLQPVPCLAEVLAVLVPAADGLAAARWLATPNRRLWSSRPIDVLRGGDDVDEVVEAAMAQARVWDATTPV
jgi:Protein of unknown function (DUF2384)